MSIIFLAILISPKKHVRNLTILCNWCLTKYFYPRGRWDFRHLIILCNWCHTKSYHPRGTWEITHAFIISGIDYGHSLMYGVPDYSYYILYSLHYNSCLRNGTDHSFLFFIFVSFGKRSFRGSGCKIWIHCTQCTGFIE